MRERILVVDDNEKLAHVLTVGFRLLGYQVTTAHDGLQAEACIRVQRPDLVILDVMMPGKNGFAVCRELKSDPATSRIPVILLTAKDRQEDVYWGHDSGADAYVTKPYDPRKLELLVAQLLKETREGHKSVSWTGLPDASCVRNEFFDRLQADGEGVLLEARLSERAAEVYVMKYGRARYQSLVCSLCWLLKDVATATAVAGVVGVEGEETCVILLHPSETEQFISAAQGSVAELLRNAYDQKDRDAGSIRLAEPKSNRWEVVPLLTLVWHKLEHVEVGTCTKLAALA